MVENFNGIFYLILYIISIALAGYYSFTFLFNKEKEFAKYNIDTSAAPAANFGIFWVTAFFLVGLYILFTGPEGTWPFFVINIIVFAMSTVYQFCFHFNIAFLYGRDKVNSTIEQPLVSVVVLVINLIIVYGFHLFVEQRISMGAIIATMILSGKTLAPLAKMAQTLGRANSAYVARKNLIEFFSQQRRERFSNTGLQSVKPDVVIDVTNASVKLSVEGKPIFNNLNFSVKQGEKIAVIGKSGAGKTTLLRSICGLLEPETGSVQINGDQASSIPRDEIFNTVGVVLQESWLFSGTLRENLTLGYDEFSDEEIKEALDFAGAHFLGENSQEMLEFPILDRGSNLSGGQRQVICVARALLQKPSIILLDEATSAMDANMEMTFLKYLHENKLKQTILAVTHKPNVINICDRVMLIDNGKIAWDGKLNDYKALVAKQKSKVAKQA